jgi:predicted MFS family arabinose efflux permease
MWFLVDQMSSLGYTYVFGTALISVIGFANLVGRLLGSIVKFKTKSFPAVYNMLYTCPILAVGHSLFILLKTLDKWMYVACAVHGFAFGLMNVFLPVTMYEFVDNENFQQAVSFLNMAYGVGNLLSNYVGGSI